MLGPNIIGEPAALQLYKKIADQPMIVFDKAYINYQQFDAFRKRDIFYINRQKNN